MAHEVRIEGREGGAFEIVTGPAKFRSKGRILSWDPPRLLEFEWKVEPHPHLPNGEDSQMRWELEEMKDGTLLTFTHRRLTRPTALGFAPGTHALLDRLEAHLSGSTMPDFMERSDEVKQHYPTWEE